MKFSGSNKLSEDIISDLRREKTLAKHETMQDDIYRKRSEHLYRKKEMPAWLRLLICAFASVVFYAIFASDL